MRPISTALMLAAAVHAAFAAAPAALRAQAPASPTPTTPAAATQAGSAAAAPATAAPRPATTLPATPLGRLAQQLLDVMDSGDSAAAARFAAEHLGRDVRGRSAKAMESLLVRLQAQSGGLRVERVRMVGSALRLMTQARNGRRWLGMELEPAAGDSTRLASVLVMPMDDPGIRRPPAPWATEKLTDAQIATIIRERVKQAVDADRFSGVVLVARGDEILVHEVHGFADRERGLRNTPATPFATMSLGKMFTGTAIAQLVAAGRLSFDDTLARVLPGYPNMAAAERITIRQLLTHTAGVPEPFLSPRFDVRHDYGTHDRVLATFADAPLNANAGRSFDYSNGGFAALAAVVEHISGLPYHEYLRRNVWTPAGMTVNGGTPAVGYARFSEFDPLGIEPRRPESVRPNGGCPRVLGFGCGAFTAGDLFRFGRALRTGKLLPPALADSIVAGRVSMGGGPMKYAYGFYEQVMNGMKVVGHSGSNPDTGHDADLQMVWDGEWTVVVLSNYDAPAGMELEMPILDLLSRQVALTRAPAP